MSEQTKWYLGSDQQLLLRMATSGLIIARDERDGEEHLLREGDGLSSRDTVIPFVDDAGLARLKRLAKRPWRSRMKKASWC